jgi:hypothetical protein
MQRLVLNQQEFGIIAAGGIPTRQVFEPTPIGMAGVAGEKTRNIVGEGVGFIMQALLDAKVVLGKDDVTGVADNVHFELDHSKNVVVEHHDIDWGGHP